MTPRLLPLLCVAGLVSCTAAKPPSAAVEPGATKREDDLGKAWEPPPEPVAAPSAVVALPPVVDRREPFRKALEASRSAKKEEARAKALEAAQLAEALSGDERRVAHQRLFALAEDKAAAEAAAHAWLEACGPESLEACRVEAAKALEKSGGDGKPWLEAEQCLARAERISKDEPCLDEALRDLKRDPVTHARVALAKALHEKPDARRPKLERVDRVCTERRCAGVRRKALQALVKDALAKDEPDKALKYALKEAKVLAESLDASERAWARTNDIEAVCLKYDAKSGAGACRKLEKQLNGGYTFLDFSREPSAGVGLDGDTVRRVNAHYGPLASECLAEQAGRMESGDAARFNLRWVVVNDGRVGAVELLGQSPEHPLRACFEKQFSLWRYPRYEGEYQHVEQSFTVTAARRLLR